MSENKKIKIVIVGDGGVGKTALTNYLTEKKFPKVYTATMGVEVHPKKYGDQILSLWDTAGQEKYSGIKEGYYLGGKYAIVMFDVTSGISFKNIANYIVKLKESVPDIEIMICGNKIDAKNRKISKKDAELIAKQINIPYSEISSKTGSGISDVMEYFLNK